MTPAVFVGYSARVYVQGFDFIKSEIRLSNHAGWMKTNHVNVTTFSHVELMYSFELNKFNELFFFFFGPKDTGSAQIDPKRD